MAASGHRPGADQRPLLAATDEYLAYVARPDDPVWAQHRHGRNRRPPESGPRVVSLEDVLTGAAEVRSDDTQITFSERGNIQGAQFFAVAGLVYELARERGLGRELPTSWFLQDIRD